VEVPLEPPPLGVAGRDDALTRGPQLGQPVLGRGLQPRIVERERSSGGDGAEELRIFVERRDQGTPRTRIHVKPRPSGKRRRVLVEQSGKRR
jgi:hypothetical protein